MVYIFSSFFSENIGNWKKTMKIGRKQRKLEENNENWKKKLKLEENENWKKI